MPATDEIHMKDRNHRVSWTKLPGQNFKDQSFLNFTNRSRVWLVNHLSSLRWKWVPVKCLCNLNLTTGSVDQSKKAWKSSAPNHIHTLLHVALVHSTHTPLSQQTTLIFWNCVPQKHKQTTWSTSWRDEELESCPRSERSQNAVRNMTTKRNPTTLPINLYAVDPPN